MRESAKLGLPVHPHSISEPEWDTGSTATRPLLTMVIPWAGDGRLASLLTMLAPHVQRGQLRVIVSVDGKLDERAEESADSISKLATETQDGFSIIRSVERRGPGAARNAAIDVAETLYVCFVDADDLPSVEQLLLAAEVGRQRGYDVIVGGFTILRDDGPDEIQFPTAGGPLWSELLGVAGVWRFVISKDFLHKSGVRFPELRYGEDLIFLLRINALTHVLGQHSTVVYTYDDRLRHGRLTRSRPQRSAVLELHTLLREVARQGDDAHNRLCNYWLARIAVKNRSPRLLLGSARGSNGTSFGIMVRFRSFAMILSDSIALHWRRSRQSVRGSTPRLEG